MRKERASHDGRRESETKACACWISPLLRTCKNFKAVCSTGSQFMPAGEGHSCSSLQSRPAYITASLSCRGHEHEALLRSTHLLPQEQRHSQAVQQQPTEQLCAVLVERTATAPLIAELRQAKCSRRLSAARQNRLCGFMLTLACPSTATLRRRSIR